MNATAWQGPPREILGCPVPAQQVIARTDRAIVALQHGTAFPEGFSLTLHVAVRRGSLDASAWKGLLGNHASEDPGLSPPDRDLKFGIRFPDGSTAVTVEHAFPGWARPTDRPEPPMLIEVGGGSSGDDQFYESDRQLWLWPLPPPAPLELVVKWPRMGIAATSATIDGSAIVRAAGQALPYWP